MGAVGIITKTVAPVALQKSLVSLGFVEKEQELKSSIKIDDSAAKIGIEKERPKKDVLDNYVEDLRKLMDDQVIELHRRNNVAKLNNHIDIKLQPDTGWMENVDEEARPSDLSISGG